MRSSSSRCSSSCISISAWGSRGACRRSSSIFVAGNMAFAGLSILMSSRTANPRVGNGLINAITFPMMLLSGIFFSYHHFPAVGDSDRPEAPARDARRFDTEHLQRGGGFRAGRASRVRARGARRPFLLRRHEDLQVELSGSRTTTSLFPSNGVRYIEAGLTTRCGLVDPVDRRVPLKPGASARRQMLGALLLCLAACERGRPRRTLEPFRTTLSRTDAPSPYTPTVSFDWDYVKANIPVCQLRARSSGRGAVSTDNEPNDGGRAEPSTR